MRPGTLLVGTDFSDQADRAFRLAMDLAAEFEARIELVHAFDTPIPFFEPYAVSLPADWLDEAKRSSENQLQESVKLAEGREISVTARFIEGNPAHVLAREAEEIGADWIVVGTHGHGGIKQALLGSVAERVVREAHCAVLTVQSDRRPEHLLVGTDLTHHSDRALAVAAELAHEFDASLELVHALHAPVPFVTPYETVVPESVVKSAFDTAEQELERMARELARDLEMRTAVLAEPPHAALCDAAERDGADLIVVGSHGHSGLRHLMLGSVAERVLRHAPCSVMVVREPS